MTVLLLPHLGLVPATSRGDKSCRVDGQFLLQNWSPRLVPRVQTSLKCPCDFFLTTLRVNCSWDKSPRVVPLCNLFRGIIVGTRPLVCRPLVEANVYDIQETTRETKKNRNSSTSILIPNGSFFAGFSGTLGKIDRTMSCTNC